MGVRDKERLQCYPVEQIFDALYAEPGGIGLRYDFYRPDGPGPFPLVVCIHGGGWISGEKEQMHELIPFLAQMGFAAACPQYRLAPLHPFPAAVEDILSFVTFLRSRADELDLDPGRFASLGISAGGHLAAMAGLSRYADSRVQAVVDICGISDLTEPHAQHFPISHGFLEQFMGGPFEGNEETYRAASPIHQVAPGAPPFLLIHGNRDDVVPHEQSVAFERALQSAGAETELCILAGEGHSFTLEAWNRILELMGGFLQGRLLQPVEAGA
jgi:acetyl esterase/lipase